MKNLEKMANRVGRRSIKLQNNHEEQLPLEQCSLAIGKRNEDTRRIGDKK